jgi:hypothetical protein
MSSSSLTTRRQWFASARLRDPYLTRSSARRFRNAHHPGSFTDAACGGLEPPPARRLRRTYLHLSHSIAPAASLYIRAPPSRSWHTGIEELPEFRPRRRSSSATRAVNRSLAAASSAAWASACSTLASAASARVSAAAICHWSSPITARRSSRDADSRADDTTTDPAALTHHLSHRQAAAPSATC